MNKEELNRLSKIMSQLGDIHTMVAKTKLDRNEYNPISEKFSKAKVDLFYLYNELKNKNAK